MTAQELIRVADEIARKEGLSQAEWSRRAGYDECGKMISNAYKRGDCKLSAMVRLLRPLRCELVIIKHGKAMTLKEVIMEGIDGQEKQGV